MSHLFRLQPLLRGIAATKTTTRQLIIPPPTVTRKAKAWIPNGAMKRGPRGFSNGWETKDGMHIWILMPGVPKENVTVNVIGNQIYFQGTEVLDVPGVNCPEDDILRIYKGSVLFDSRFDAANVKAEIVNAIFWLRVPKFSH